MAFSHSDLSFRPQHGQPFARDLFQTTTRPRYREGSCIIHHTHDEEVVVSQRAMTWYLQRLGGSLLYMISLLGKVDHSPYRRRARQPAVITCMRMPPSMTIWQGCSKCNRINIAPLGMPSSRAKHLPSDLAPSSAPVSVIHLKVPETCHQRPLIWHMNPQEPWRAKPGSAFKRVKRTALLAHLVTSLNSNPTCLNSRTDSSSP